MSNYAKHILEQSHSFGPIQDTMQILQYQNKGNHLNTIERFYMYTEFTKDNHLNGEYNISPNRIFDALPLNLTCSRFHTPVFSLPTQETSTKITYTKGSPRERWQLR
jgi:hypothetical protein